MEPRPQWVWAHENCLVDLAQVTLIEIGEPGLTVAPDKTMHKNPYWAVVAYANRALPP